MPRTDTLAPEVREFLATRCYVHLATLMADGSPQVSPVWAETDGDLIVVNSAAGRVKDRNIKRDARVALSATHPEDPFKALMIRGRVVKVTEEGAEDGIDRLARKYIGGERYEWRRPGEVRVAYYIQPETVKTL
ncbi:MAG: PPOX class F420-dependent oxidoreductase [Acidobacteriota bacterium]|nr:PPOX class F420-dependent oxidoreductase [Acidobacteriota bacterium]MDE2712583.1 PPOX class F420-dependent oxidoreductase [Acidobacteriota bacterium]MXW71910.1 PPOX class F420-dependent oxidoreductase [Acidobacteriota bacterium]MXX87436.1 PPOX class F420-dependent oxidoreductase [Acidobacteriota bacterium]MYE44383.1 PPOX class F420-dependent oxidoreductase [Acidobacteriota bacterium]